MENTNDVLERQTARVEELLENAQREPTRGALQALASMYLSRGDTLRKRGEEVRAADDFREAAALYAHLAVQEGDASFVEAMRNAGDLHRASLGRLGQEEEADRHLLGESQLLLHLGAHEAALRGLEPIASRLREDEARFSLYVEAAQLQAAALGAAGRLEESLALTATLVDLLAERGEDDLAASLRVQQAVGLSAAGKGDESMAILDRALADFGAALDAGRQDVLQQAIEARRVRAALLAEGDRAEEALAELDRAIEWARAHGAADPDAIAELLRERSRTAFGLGKLDEALQNVEEACTRLQALVEEAPSLERIDALMEAGFERAIVHYQRRDFEAALQDANGLLGAWTAMAERAPARVDLQQRILMALDLRERCASELGRHTEALADQTRIVDGMRALLAAGAPRQLEQALAVTLERRAGTRQALGDAARAAADLAEARRLAGA